MGWTCNQILECYRKDKRRAPKVKGSNVNCEGKGKAQRQSKTEKTVKDFILVSDKLLKLPTYEF